MPTGQAKVIINMEAQYLVLLLSTTIDLYVMLRKYA